MALPDYLGTPTEAEVLERMKARIAAGIDVTEGSFMHDSLAPASIEFAIAADRMRLALEWTFAHGAFGELLDLRAAEHGIEREAAESATGTILFTGTSGTVVPVGTRVSTEATEQSAPQVYHTDSTGQLINGALELPVSAETPGVGGNAPANTVTVLVDQIPGVEGVTNPVPITGGVDQEADESLRARLLDIVAEPVGGGNQADYRRWALEVTDAFNAPVVGQVGVIPLENGPGTVTVVIVGTDMLPASPEEVALVQAAIAPGGPDGSGLAPIGANVTVESASALTVNVAADLTYEAGYDPSAVAAAAMASITDYFAQIALTADNDVRYARVLVALLDTQGIQDVATLTLNGGTADIAVGAKQVATLGTGTWT